MGRAEQFRSEILAQVLGLRVIGPWLIAEQQPFVELFIDDVFVDRLRTLGAAHWIDDESAPQILETDEIGDHALDDAPLFLGSDATGEIDDARSHGYLNIVRIEGELPLEIVANERTQLVVV